MKYTFEFKGKQKTVDIPDDWMRQQKQVLGISTKEVIELWLFDHDYVTNDAADALTEKAKGAGAGVRGEGKTRKPPARKPDEVKRELIAGLYNYIQEYAGVRDPQVTNVERMISFALGDDNYEITLSKKRKPKA